MDSTWRPAHRAGAGIGCQVSNPGDHGLPAVYTFGHPAGTTKAAEQDDAAARWWAPDGRPSTNDAANNDIESFWAAAAADPSASVRRLTGRDTAAAVKQAGRGTHVQLGFSGNEFTRSSKYRDDFCTGGAAGAGKGAAPAMYRQAQQAARANRALGTGASLCLAQMW